MQKLSRQEKQNALNEVRILASINHPNIIGYKEAFFEDTTNQLCIVMEHADGGDILNELKHKKELKENLGEKTIWHYFIQIVRGLKALHDIKICHRDIKCANIFLTKSGEAKLGDMNVSKVAKAGMMMTVTGTPYYACPEIWKNMPYDNKGDIWSLGCVLYEMITNQPPFRANSMKELNTRVCSGKYEQISSKYSPELKEVLKQCLQVQSSKRPSCEQILAMPGVQKHFTDSLDNIEARKDGKEKLLNTIRCPLNLGAVTNLMPASNYHSKQDMPKPPVKEAKPESAPSEADRTSSSRISVLY